MSGRFADGLPRLAGLAGRLLGWRAEEFWAATPSELMWMLGWGEASGAAGAAVSRAELLRWLEEDVGGR